MSSVTKVGKDTSLPTGGLFQTFRDLLKQREALDHQILRLQGRFFQMMENKVVPKDSTESFSSKKYVARMQNHTILKEAIRECMIPGKKMGMKDILSALKKTGAYQTHSKYFYTMVNNKLNRDPKISKVSRGVFVLHKNPGRPKAKAS